MRTRSSLRFFFFFFLLSPAAISGALRSIIRPDDLPVATAAIFQGFRAGREGWWYIPNLGAREDPAKEGRGISVTRCFSDASADEDEVSRDRVSPPRHY